MPWNVDKAPLSSSKINKQLTKHTPYRRIAKVFSVLVKRPRICAVFAPDTLANWTFCVKLDILIGKALHRKSRQKTNICRKLHQKKNTSCQKVSSLMFNLVHWTFNLLINSHHSSRVPHFFRQILADNSQVSRFETPYHFISMWVLVLALAVLCRMLSHSPEEKQA